MTKYYVHHCVWTSNGRLVVSTNLSTAVLYSLEEYIYEESKMRQISLH